MTERVVTLDKHPYEEHYFDVVKDKQPAIGHNATGRTIRLVRTPAEIDAEIQALKAVRPQVRRHSYFGDDNRSRVGAEIEVLERLREPTLDAPEDVEAFERTLEIPGQTAWDWLIRVKADRPSKDWSALLAETELPADAPAGAKTR